MKIPNSFSTTIFNRHRIQYKSRAFSETKFSNVFFFLPSTIDRVEFGENFDPSKLDYANPGKESTRESVVKKLKKVVDLSNQDLQRHSDCLLAKTAHNNESLLWPDGQLVPTDKFALTYQIVCK